MPMYMTMNQVVFLIIITGALSFGAGMFLGWILFVWAGHIKRIEKRRMDDHYYAERKDQSDNQSPR